MKTRTRARSRHVEQRTCAILLRVICAIFDSRRGRYRVSGYGIRQVSTCRVCVGMGFASRVRLGLFVPCSGVGGGLRSCPGYAKKGGGTLWCPLPVRFGCGGVLLSHTLPGAVPSPCQVLASGFGMGPGVSPGPWPPQIFCYPSHGPRLRVFPRGIVVGWGPDSGRD